MKTPWSQNFLIDNNIARKSVLALSLSPEDSVLEIGPGKGKLTQLLVEHAKSVTGVEIDPILCHRLKEQFKTFNSFTLISNDFLKISLRRFPVAEKMKVIGNLPYAVVSPILQKILEWEGWSVGIFMVQTEVGERIAAEPGIKDYGILSVSIQSRCIVEKIQQVSKYCFRPIPNVESVLIRIVPLQNPIVHPRDLKRFFSVVRASFAHRRKTLKNSLAFSLKWPISTIVQSMEKCGLHHDIRAEMLSVYDFKKLSEILYNSK